MGRSRSRTTDRRQARRAPRQHSWNWRLAAFLALVFAAKAIAVSQLQYHPLLAPGAGLDTASYVHLARRVIGGDVMLGPGLYYLSPLYIYFLALTLAVSDSFTFVRIVQVALGTVAVGFVFATARIWFGERAAWIASTLAALTGVLTFYEIVLLPSALDAFLTAAALHFLARGLATPERAVRERMWAAREPSVQLIVAGILFGLMILNRPNAAIAIGGIVGVLLLARWWRTAVLVAAGVLAALAPVVIRNAIVSGDAALVSSHGGLNFYIGNHERATGQYVPLDGVRANIDGQSEDTRRVAEAATGRSLSDGEVSAHFARLAMTWIVEHPAAAAKLFAKKLALVFNARHQWLDFSYPYYAHDTGSILRFLAVGPWLLVPLGFAGLVLAVRRGPPSPPRGFGEAGEIPDRAFVVWAAFVPLYAVSVAVFFVAERYRLPMFLPLCVAAGGALDWMVEAFRKPTSRLRRSAATARQAHNPPSPLRGYGEAGAWRIVAAVCLAAGALTFWPFNVNDGRFDERLRLAKTLMNRGEYGAAGIELQTAHDINPSHTVAEFNLGMALVSSGRGEEGIAHLRRAVDAGVPQKGARYALVNAMLMTGDRDGAVTLLRTYAPAEDDDAESCYRVGLLAMDAGAPLVAQRFLKRAMELRPGWPEPRQALERVTFGR